MDVFQEHLPLTKVLHLPSAMGYMASRLLLDYKFLESHSTNIEFVCRGCDPLQCAAEGGHLEIFELLLKHDCNPMGQDHLNATLLHYAASGGNLHIMQKLLDLGCDKHALTKYGRSVLHYSAYGETPLLALPYCQD